MIPADRDLKGLYDWEIDLVDWAYDEDRVLSDQDEDLIVGHQQNFRSLLPCADDPECPKADYILGCIDFYLMFEVLWGKDLAPLREAIEFAQTAERSELWKWADLQKRRIAYRVGTGPVSREEALLMGQDLLNGLSRECDISIVGDDRRKWKVELSVPPFHRHKEWLAIDKTTGRFEFWR